MKIYKFFLPTCGPCKRVGKILDELNIDVTNIDMNDDESEELADKYKVYSVPTIIKVDDEGNEICRAGSNSTKEELIEKFC